MLEIAPEDIARSLRADNPWWSRPASLEEDPFPTRRAYFDEFRDLAVNKAVRRSVILLGPRRVGKTVMLEQFVTECIRSGQDPQTILYASLDTPLYSGLPLERLLELFARETGHDPDADRLVVFDEIQYLRDWEKHLKVLTDRFPNTRFIASGSAAAALRLKSKESGAGRFTDFLLPPLTFAEFLRFRGIEDRLVEVIQEQPVRRFRAVDIGSLNEEFVRYLNFGGYPEAVMQPGIQTDIKRYLGRDIIDKVLLRDLPSLYGIEDIQELNRLFTTLAYHTGGEISLSSLASTSGVASSTISRYLEYLEAAFLIVRVKKVDESGRTFKRMRNFKVYLTNPSMRAALFGPVSATDEAMGALAETAIFSQWLHTDSLRNIHYARWKKGRRYLEVDLAHVDPATMKPSWAYEVKWSDRYYQRPSELVGLLEFAHQNGLIDRRVGATTRTQQGDREAGGATVSMFPCALHCYQVGRNITEGLVV